MTTVLTATRQKFLDPHVTLDGSERARVPFTGLNTLWFNTGTLCNLTCKNCYIESSPTNDALVYLTRAEVSRFLDEAEIMLPRPREIGFTGGEPFMNPDMIAMADDALTRGFHVLILTNAMKPMHHVRAKLAALREAHGDRLALRVSLDGHNAADHEALRGPRSWQPTIDGLTWLAAEGFNIAIAGRTVNGESELEARVGFAALFSRLGLVLDAHDPSRLVLFPEMDLTHDVPEITTACWSILKKSPASVMCSNSRMVVKSKGAPDPHVVSCTLLPYTSDFNMGATLADAARDVSLNHHFCAQFCVLGGASCSA
ncbi:MAG: radical SAM protein [Parvibaculum sp.]|nr:radical SAM protein [Parvibaculum sp.]